MKELPLEYCIICGEPTGRAGRDDDSIYVELKQKYGAYDAGEIIGGLCEECNRAMLQLNIIEEGQPKTFITTT